MPTPYSGNPNATQSPSPPPSPGAIPIANLPVDGDPPNAATFAQAYKVAVDFIAWLMAPFAVLAAWAQEVFAWRNARLNRVFAVDHMGFPSGRILQVDEGWLDATAGHSTPASGLWFGKWNYGLFGASGAFMGMDGVGNGAETPFGPIVQVSTNSVHAAAALIESVQPWHQLGEIASGKYGSCSLCFDWSITGTSDPDASSTFAVGLSDGSLKSGASTNAFNTGGCQPGGAAIYATGGAGGNYIGYAFPPGGAAHSTGGLGPVIARNAIHRLRIDVYGPDDADDTTGQVRFIIDGVDVGGGLAFDLSGGFFFPFIRMSSNGVDPCTLNVGPVQFRSRLATGDVAI